MTAVSDVFRQRLESKLLQRFTQSDPARFLRLCAIYWTIALGNWPVNWLFTIKDVNNNISRVKALIPQKTDFVRWQHLSPATAFIKVLLARIDLAGANRLDLMLDI